MNKIDSGENPNSQDLLDHLHTIHNRHAGLLKRLQPVVVIQMERIVMNY